MNKFSCGIIVLSLIVCVCGLDIVHGQQPDLSMEVELNESLLTSQNLDLQSIIAGDGRGYELYRLFFSNDNASEAVADLYLSIDFRSEKKGLLFSRNQVNIQDFSLKPAQKVSATNNTILDGLPGVEENIYFEGSFTPEGQRFFNELQGLSSLPRDRYTLEFSLYQDNNRNNGGTLVASAFAELGFNIVEDIRDFYLIYPGEPIGYEAEITNRYPNFVWQGAANLSYRLIVVEERDNESPESLLGGAASSEPIMVDGSSDTGSLLEYEMLDVIVNQSSFQYPNSGVQSLEAGKTYYWQIISLLRSNDAIEPRESEIWSFTLSDQTTGAEEEQLSGEITRILKKILGERYDQLEEAGSLFQSIDVDGNVLQEAEALEALLRLDDQIDREEISIIIEE